jgi:hypothetical protein
MSLNRDYIVIGDEIEKVIMFVCVLDVYMYVYAYVISKG